MAALFLLGVKGMKTGFFSLTAIGFGLEDYRQMFALSEADLALNMLDCRAGASAFAAQLNQQGGQVVATDPLYANSFEHIQDLIKRARQDINNTLLSVPDVHQFLQEHDDNVEIFLNDFEQGFESQRYQNRKLPSLGFDDERFDLALISHYLFTYTQRLSFDDHMKAILELLRVANEVRIFPLVTDQGEISPYVGDIIAQCQEHGFGVELKSVNYKIQQKGNAMLRLWSEACDVEKHDNRP